MDATRAPRLAGLDGLRGLAVVAVLLYHADLAAGGFLGVELFFVLSGYLITVLLAAEWRRSGRVDLVGFWRRRARRLLPAMWLMTTATVGVALLALPDEVARLRGPALAGGLFLGNWWAVLVQEPYFVAVGRPSLFRHLWSLGVEGQFYLVWPPLLALGLRRLPARWLAAAALVGAGASAALMAGLDGAGTDQARLYYGTDTRATGLLLGAALALVWAPASTDRPGGAGWLDGLGLVGLGALAALTVGLSEADPLLYRGGLALVGLAGAAVIAAAVDGRTRLCGRALGWAPLRWLGTRSYGIYLWHWPIFALTRPGLDTALDGAPLLVVRVGASLLLAELSYRLVERPIQSGVAGRAWRGAGAGLRGRSAVLASGGAALVLVLATSVAAAKPAERPAYLIREAIDTWDVDPAGGAADPIAPSLASPADLPADAIGPPLGSPADREAHPTAASLASPADPDIRRIIASLAIPADGVPSPVADLDPTAEADAGASASASLRRERPRPDPTPRPLDVPVAAGVDGPAAPSAAAADPPSTPPADPSPASSAPPAVAADPPAAPLATPTTRPAAPAPRARTTRPTGPAAAPLPTRRPPALHRVSALGDSVMLGAADALQGAIDGVAIDAAVSRQVSSAIGILQRRVAAGQLGDVVVLQLGNNGIFTAGQFDEIMGQFLAGVPRVVFVNLRVPRPWEAPNNAAIADGVGRYPVARLVDWNRATAGRPELLYDDGMHLRPAGADLYANLIAAAVAAP